MGSNSTGTRQMIGLQIWMESMFAMDPPPIFKSKHPSFIQLLSFLNCLCGLDQILLSFELVLSGLVPVFRFALAGCADPFLPTGLLFWMLWAFAAYVALAN